MVNLAMGVRRCNEGIDKNGRKWNSLRYEIINPPTHVTIKKLPSGTRIRAQYSGSGILEEKQILKNDGREIVFNRKNITILKPFEELRFMVLKKVGHWTVQKQDIIPIGIKSLFNETIYKQLHKIR